MFIIYQKTKNKKQTKDHIHVKLEEKDAGTVRSGLVGFVFNNSIFFCFFRISEK